MYFKKKKVVKWEITDILKILGGGGVLAAIVSLVGSAMGWLRFGKKDSAEIGKIQSETALDAATIAEKKIADEVRISDAALQWTVNLATRLEQANLMIDKKQEENERLHGIIDIMKKDFEREFQKLKDNFNKRIKELENEFERSKQELIKEREENREEIKRLKNQLDGNSR